jgi:hypothetical protein
LPLTYVTPAGCQDLRIDAGVLPPKLWRPIKTIHKDPLALADATTVADSDLVAASIIYPRHRKESWTVKAGPAHRWYYKHAQEPNEIALIKCFDSDIGAAARRVPHCAVEDPAESESDCRESVEVRCLVLY